MIHNRFITLYSFKQEDGIFFLPDGNIQWKGFAFRFDYYMPKRKKRYEQYEEIWIRLLIWNTVISLDIKLRQLA